MGAANKVSGNKITGIKVLKKKVLSLGKKRSSLGRFHKKNSSEEGGGFKGPEGGGVKRSEGYLTL